MFIHLTGQLVETALDECEPCAAHRQYEEENAAFREALWRAAWRKVTLRSARPRDKQAGSAEAGPKRNALSLS